MIQLPEDIKQASEALLAGKVILLPTDTVYGLAASPNHPAAVDLVYKIKGRPRHMNLPIMVASPQDLEALGANVTPIAQQLFDSPFSPGALSIIMGLTDNKADWLSDRDEIAVRIPNDEWLLAVLRETGPLLVTSANEHGSKIDLGNIELVKKDILHPADYIVERGQINSIHSTMVNCNVPQVELLREGAIAYADILKHLNL